PRSPLELMHVSGYQPYQLTQRFISPNRDGQTVKYNHRAPWLDEDVVLGGPSHRLYRLFEFLETGTEAAGASPGGGLPGRVNLNTVWDPEVFRAVCDPQPANRFKAKDVNDRFTQLFYDPAGSAPDPWRRTQGLTPGGSDRPLKAFAACTY